METSKTLSVANTLAFSSICLSIACFIALVHVEIELHAHQKMLQVLTPKKEENMAPSETENNELITFPPYGHSSKGEYEVFFCNLITFFNFFILTDILENTTRITNY